MALVLEIYFGLALLVGVTVLAKTLAPKYFPHLAHKNVQNFHIFALFCLFIQLNLYSHWPLV